MIPKFLSEFKEDLENLKLESVKILAQPVGEKEVLVLTQSKFLGKPYLPISMAYPHDKNGKPMILLAQINFSDVPTIKNYPQSGILQLFISPTDWYDMEDYKIIFHDKINEEAQEDFSFLTEDIYEECPIWCEHKLHFNKAVEYGGFEDIRFNIDFNGQDYYEYQDNLTNEEIKAMDDLLDGTGHKIGGYAYFTQSDPREQNDGVDVLLLQIDSDDKIMFGDCGVAHLFIDDKYLKKKDFSKAWFYWDCC